MKNNKRYLREIRIRMGDCLSKFAKAKGIQRFGYYITDTPVERAMCIVIPEDRIWTKQLLSYMERSGFLWILDKHYVRPAINPSYRLYYDMTLITVRIPEEEDFTHGT